MVFCTSCGKELTPGKKFCESCGAPVEQNPVPPSPSPLIQQQIPSVPQAPPQKKSFPFLLLAGILIALAVIAAGVWFIGLPYLQKAGNIPFVPSKPTPTPTLPAFELTPTAYETPEIIVTTLTPDIQREGRFEEDYEQIYSLNQKFRFGQKVTFPYTLTRPPLYIKFNVTPTMISHHRLVSIGTSEERMVNTTDPDPNAWFEVKVLEAGSGSVIDRQGFGKDYSDVTKQEFMVRKNGNYEIVMSGNEVDADVRILIGT